MIDKRTETRKAKVFEGTGFRYRLAEGVEDRFKRQFKKDPDKSAVLIARHIEKGMRKYVDNSVSGAIWDEDIADIYSEVMKIIEA